MNENMKSSVQEVVQSLVSRNGKVSASDLVSACKPKDSQAHDAFEWNDRKAGHSYRLIQARTWIRLIVVRTDESEAERLVHIPADRDDENENREGIYKPLSAVREDVDEFRRALDAALARLHSAQQAVKELQELAAQSDAPDRVAMVAQIARGLDIMQQAMASVH